MKAEQQCQSQQPNEGLTASEALEFHRGWTAAVKGEPRDVGQGSMWMDGFLTYHLMADGPGRSWKRH